MLNYPQNANLCELANYVIYTASKHGLNVDCQKLQHLIYIISYMYINEIEPNLRKEVTFFARPSGPVEKNVYARYNRPNTSPIVYSKKYPPALDLIDPIRYFINRIVIFYLTNPIELYNHPIFGPSSLYAKNLQTVINQRKTNSTPVPWPNETDGKITTQDIQQDIHNLKLKNTRIQREITFPISNLFASFYNQANSLKTGPIYQRPLPNKITFTETPDSDATIVYDIELSNHPLKLKTTTSLKIRDMTVALRFDSYIEDKTVRIAYGIDEFLIHIKIT